MHLKPDAVPFVDAPRRFPVHLRDRLKAELDRRIEQQIIESIEHHTDWRSSITCAEKKDGTLRVWLDKQKLNKALKRRAHKIPTVEEITAGLSEVLLQTGREERILECSARRRVEGP